MSATPSTSDSTAVTSFPVLYVVLGGAALFAVAVFAITCMSAVRHYRRRPPSLGHQLTVTPVVIAGGKPEQEEPELFNIYVKPGLEVQEARFEYILPMAARIADKSQAVPVINALSTPPSVLRTHDKAGAPAEEGVFGTYDVAVLIVMPHPHLVDHWDELDEYAIGTTEVVAPPSLDDSIHPWPLHSIPIP